MILPGGKFHWIQWDLLLSRIVQDCTTIHYVLLVYEWMNANRYGFVWRSWLRQTHQAHFPQLLLVMTTKWNLCSPSHIHLGTNNSHDHTIIMPFLWAEASGWLLLKSWARLTWFRTTVLTAWIDYLIALTFALLQKSSPLQSLEIAGVSEILC